MARGRPVRSEIRQHIVDILHNMGKAYGYEIYKVYRQIFPKISLRTVYYHLQKGLDMGIFKVEEIQREEGDYSWGGTTERKYYSLASEAKPSGDHRVREFFEKRE